MSDDEIRWNRLAEVWGERESPAPALLRCGDDGAPSDLRLIDVRPAYDADAAGAEVDVPWIACTRCEQVLRRVHVVELWGDLSCIPAKYVVAGPGGAVVPFDDDQAAAAFGALVAGCGGR